MHSLLVDGGGSLFFAPVVIVGALLLSSSCGADAKSAGRPIALALEGSLSIWADEVDGIVNTNAPVLRWNTSMLGDSVQPKGGAAEGKSLDTVRISVNVSDCGLALEHTGSCSVLWTASLTTALLPTFAGLIVYEGKVRRSDWHPLEAAPCSCADLYLLN